MIRWCAYCQRYQGEVAPYDDFSVTHTICAACAPGALDMIHQPASLAAIQRFFERVARAGALRATDAASLVAEGAALGIEPVDLLLGILQPVVRQVGERWARAEATIAEEHQVSALCSAIIDLLVEANASLARLRQAPRPQVLLVIADGNFHTLGLRMIEVYLLAHHVSTFTVYPGLPAGEVVALAQELRPRVVALSAAMPEQLASASEVARRIAAWPEETRPAIVVGGFALQSERCLPPREAPFVASRDLGVLLELALTPRVQA